jgi:hypothetical protein
MLEQTRMVDNILVLRSARSQAMLLVQSQVVLIQVRMTTWLETMLPQSPLVLVLVQVSIRLVLPMQVLKTTCLLVAAVDVQEVPNARRLRVDSKTTDRLHALALALALVLVLARPQLVRQWLRLDSKTTNRLLALLALA